MPTPTATPASSRTRAITDGRGPTRIRHVRCDDTLWTAAAEMAADDGESISHVVRALLRGYCRGDFEV